MVADIILYLVAIGILASSMYYEARARRQLAEAREKRQAAIQAYRDAMHDSMHEREEARRWLESGVRLGLRSRVQETSPQTGVTPERSNG